MKPRASVGDCLTAELGRCCLCDDWVGVIGRSGPGRSEGIAMLPFDCDEEIGAVKGRRWEDPAVVAFDVAGCDWE